MKKNEPKIDRRAKELWQQFCEAQKLAAKAYIRLGRAVRVEKDREKQAEQAEKVMRTALYKYFKAHGLAAGDISSLSRLAMDEQSCANTCSTTVSTR